MNPFGPLAALRDKPIPPPPEDRARGYRDMLRDHLLPRLLGRDPVVVEAIWKDLFFHTHATAVGAITSLALACVDTALWDWRARSLDLPLWQLLGGAQRRAVLSGRAPVFAPLSCSSTWPLHAHHRSPCPICCRYECNDSGALRGVPTTARAAHATINGIRTSSRSRPP